MACQRLFSALFGTARVGTRAVGRSWPVPPERRVQGGRGRRARSPCPAAVACIPPALLAVLLVVLGLVISSAAEEVPPQPSAEAPVPQAPAARAERKLIKPQDRRERLGAVPAEPIEDISFLTTEQLRQLGPLSFAGSNTSLRQSLKNLSLTLHIAVLLDRRIDPEQIVDFDLTMVPLAAALSQMADRADAGAVLLGPVAYFGPRPTAGALRTLSALRTQDALRLPARQRAAAMAISPLTWPALSSPVEIFQQLGTDAGVKISGLEQLPHDLMAAARLPAMPWVDRLTLVAAQFGLTFEFAPGGRSVALVPIPDDVRIERSYPAGGDAAQAVTSWKKIAPDAEFKVNGGRIVVRARIEDHERIAPPRAGTATTTREGARTTTRAGQQVHTLKMENVPLDAFLAALTEKLSLTFELDQAALSAAGIKPDMALTVDVQNASLDELLRAALDPAGLGFKRQDKKVIVTVKGK